jgi:sulfopyruvate decarboxylase TPP-binding subunit
MSVEPNTSESVRADLGSGRTSEEVSAALLGALKEAGVTLTACLPDDWVSPLIARLDAEPSITNVRVAREPEIVGIAAGAFFGGVRAAGVLGSTGFLTCISELGGLALKHGIPLFLVVSLRSGVYEHQTFQETQSRTMRPLVETLDYPSLLIDRPERIDLIPEAYAASRLHKRPYVVWLTKSLVQARTPDL